MKLALKVAELTGDVGSADAALLEDADIICTTPEKLGELDRHIVCKFSWVSPEVCNMLHCTAVVCRLHHTQKEGSRRSTLLGRGETCLMMTYV